MNVLEILFAKVSHRRLVPIPNEFVYRVFYVMTPVTHKPIKQPYFFSFNRFNLVSLFTKDHGAHTGNPWRTWVIDQCARGGISVAAEDTVYLISHPRLFGFVFNPISFWLIFEKNEYLKTVLCEVRNTFGDNHNYMLAHPGGGAIRAGDIFTAQKGLYVSPFNNTEGGHYSFTFDTTPTSFKTTIDYFENNLHILAVSMAGKKRVCTTPQLIRAILVYPFMTCMTIFRIHLQAARLYCKGVKNTLAHRPGPTAGKTTYGSLEKKTRF